MNSYFGKLNISKENTTLIPFNFNQYDNASELITICQKHEGNIQDSFALMLKTIKATDSSSFNEALQKIMSAMSNSDKTKQLQSDNSNLKNENEKLKIELSQNANLEELYKNEVENNKKLNIQIQNLTESLSKLEQAPAPKSDQLPEIDDGFMLPSSNTQKQSEQTASSGMIEPVEPNKTDKEETPNNAIKGDNTQKTDPEDLGLNGNNSSDDFYKDPDETEQRDLDEPTHFNDMVRDAMYPHAQFRNNPSPQNKEYAAIHDGIEKLKINNDPSDFIPNADSKRIDAILDKALNELQECDEFNIDYVYDDNAKDAALKEALSIYEKIDKETYPELYELPEDTLVSQLAHFIYKKRMAKKSRNAGSEFKSRELLSKRSVLEPELNGNTQSHLKSETLPQPKTETASEAKESEGHQDQNLSRSEPQSEMGVALAATTGNDNIQIAHDDPFSRDLEEITKKEEEENSKEQNNSTELTDNSVESQETNATPSENSNPENQKADEDKKKTDDNSKIEEQGASVNNSAQKTIFAMAGASVKQENDDSFSNQNEPDETDESEEISEDENDDEVTSGYIPTPEELLAKPTHQIIFDVPSGLLTTKEKLMRIFKPKMFKIVLSYKDCYEIMVNNNDELFTAFVNSYRQNNWKTPEV